MLKKLFFITIIALLAGCTPSNNDLKIDVADGSNPWTNLNFENDSTDFQFAIVSDLTGGYRPPVFEQAVEKINLLQPEFVMSIGDLIQGGSTIYDKTPDGKRIFKPKELDRQWCQFNSWVEKLNMPFFYLPGNHDISGKTTVDKWHNTFGKSYYHFIYKNVLFLCIDTQDPPIHGFSDDQRDYFINVLKQNTNVKWTLVFMHQPAWIVNDADVPEYWWAEKKWRGTKYLQNFRQVETLLAQRPYTLFSGHHHAYLKDTKNGQGHYILATTGGQGTGEKFTTKYGTPSKKLAGLDKGQFDHIMWVTMTNKGPVIANLLLKGILDDDPCNQIN
jgi:hypothetical protein